MAKKTYIKLEGVQYLAELVDEVYSKNGLHQGLLFRIYDNDGETVGCLSTFVSLTTKAIWNNQETITPEIKENLFLRILPHIPFAASVKDFKSIYPDCLQLFVDSSNTRYLEEEKVQYLRGKESPQDLVKHLVFNGNIDDDQVQRDVLTYLYEKHLEDRHSFKDTMYIARALFIDEDIVFRCLDYLEDDGYVEGTRPSGTPGILHPKITTAGVRFVRSNFQVVRSGTGVIVMGDYVGKDKITTNIKGYNIQNIVKSSVNESFNMNLVYQKVDALKEVIEKEYKGEDKEFLIGEVEEIKTLASEKKNFPQIRKLLGGVMTRTAEIATIGTICLELYKIFTPGV